MLKKFPRLKRTLSAIFLVTILVGLIIGVYLARREQDIRRKATHECFACNGKMTDMTLRYLGSSSAQIKVVQKHDNGVVYDGMVDPNQEFSFSGKWKWGTLSTEISVYVNDQLNVKIHTSCSDPSVVPGAVFGDFLIVAAKSRKGGNVCPLITPTPQLTLTPAPTNTPPPSATPTGKPEITPTSTPEPTATPTTPPEEACLGDRVVLDEDRDGIQDIGEVGVSNITVECYDDNGELIASAVTDNEGFYQICELTPGDYRVKFLIPEGYSLSSKNQGNDPSVDSDADESTFMTESITLLGGQNNLTIDALLYTLSSPTSTPTNTPTNTPYPTDVPTSTPISTSTPTGVSPTSTPPPGATNTPSPEPTEVLAQETLTPTPVYVADADELPDAGYSLPTLLSFGFGLLLIFVASIFLLI
jgi:hypothetical protein